MARYYYGPHTAVLPDQTTRQPVSREPDDHEPRPDTREPRPDTRETAARHPGNRGQTAGDQGTRRPGTAGQETCGSRRLPSRGSLWRGHQQKYAQDRDKRVAFENSTAGFQLSTCGIGGHQADRDAGAMPGARHGQGEPLPDVVAGLPV